MYFKFILYLKPESFNISLIFMKPSRIEAKVDLGYLPAGKSFLTQLLRRYIICSKFELFKK